MRILQIIHNLELAGAEVLVGDLTLGLNRRGVDCELYLLRSTQSQIERSLLAQGIRVYTGRRASLYSPLQVRSLATHLRTCSYDVVHVHLFPAQFWAVLATKMSKLPVPLVITEHSAYNYRRRPVYRPIDRWMYANCHAIACVSDATREALLRWIPETAVKALTCPNGIDLEAFTGAPASAKSGMFSVSNDSPVILSVGRMDYQKDHATTIRALTLIRDAHLFLVGVGSEMPQHEQLAREIGVAHRVHFLGQRRDIPQLMKAANVFVQSSRFEGFGIAALEAMACGLPVVASQVPGLAELVGGAGLLFEPGNHVELAKHLNGLLGNAGQRVQLRDAGQRRAALYSIHRTIDCYEQLYRQLGGRQGTGNQVVEKHLPSRVCSPFGTSQSEPPVAADSRR
jgi:glycosyltransferase involved in cell wall biosynthesis